MGSVLLSAAFFFLCWWQRLRLLLTISSLWNTYLQPLVVHLVASVFAHEFLPHWFGELIGGHPYPFSTSFCPTPPPPSSILHPPSLFLRREKASGGGGHTRVAPETRVWAGPTLHKVVSQAMARGWHRYRQQPPDLSRGWHVNKHGEVCDTWQTIQAPALTGEPRTFLTLSELWCWC